MERAGEGQGSERAAWLSEPTTTLTDYVLAALTGAFALLLVRRGLAIGDAGVVVWGGAFAATAAAALVGGTVHGFATRLGEARKRMLWLTTLVLTGLVGFCLIVGAAIALAPALLREALVALAALKLAGALFLLVRRQDFRFLLYDAGVSLLVVLALVLLAAWRGPAPGAGWIAAGAGLSLVAAAVQQSGITLHRHFNHNDLFHVIQMLASYLLFRGGMEM